MARRSKDGSIIINVGSDAQRHLDRVAKRERIASEKAAKREAKKAATRQRQALRQAGKRAAQMARAIQRQRDTAARRKAAREARKNWRPDPSRKKRSVHPKGPYATEKYTSYARRLERSRKLIATQTSPTKWQVNSYTVTTTTDAIAISCNCPDFTQIDMARNWIGSKAGPFNPCKHMMAITKFNVIMVGVAVTSAGVVLPNYREARGITGNRFDHEVTQSIVAGIFGGVTYYQYIANGISSATGWLPTPSLEFEIIR